MKIERRLERRGDEQWDMLIARKAGLAVVAAWISADGLVADFSATSIADFGRFETTRLSRAEERRLKSAARRLGTAGE